MRAVKVYVPVHITGIWLPYYTDDVFRTGSYGAGLVLSPRIVVEAIQQEKSIPELYLNGEPIVPQFFIELVKELRIKNMRFNVKTPYKLGVGYGLSGSISIGIAVSYLKLKSENMYPLGLKSAHAAEVKARTGLGDVIAEAEGEDLELRLKPGAPGIGLVKSISLNDDLKIVTIDLGFERTSDLLQRYTGNKLEVSKRLLNRLFKRPSLEEFLRSSRIFSKTMGMLSENLDKKLRNIFNSCLGYYVKKKVAVAVIEGDHVEKIIDKCREVLRGYQLHVLTPTKGGVIIENF